MTFFFLLNASIMTWTTLRSILYIKMETNNVLHAQDYQ